MQHNLALHPDRLKEAEGLIVPALSNLVTGVAAGADVFGLVNLSDRPLVVSGIRLRWVTTTAFTAAQALAFRLNKVYGFTVLHSSGGKSVQGHYQNQAGIAGSIAGDRVPLTDFAAYIADTGAITGATYTGEDTDEPELFAVGAGSTLPGVYEDFGRDDGLPLVLTKNTGIVINNHILMGAGGVGNLFVGIDAFRLG